ncbi:hypothetical protein JYG33_03395 [Alcaligenes sp. SORT26]|uniref:hypothetical protein n=1 Tax=Alcaligenes sp. SORT26 TaxID=2813780 RepID=UPI001A9DAEE9|nr:hypothetical protein [Alcaligenes sp. SORT26]QTC00526.1 hypothetical protein JYG33_03395 [Alcaligenes sp. SORT26]
MSGDFIAWDACSETLRWLQGVEDMADLSENLHSHVDSFQPSTSHEDMSAGEVGGRFDEFVLTYRRSLNADHFFLEATRNASRWAGHLLKLDPSIEAEVNDFEAAIVEVKAIRDMRVHADDYMVPGRKGRRKDFVSQVVENDIPVAMVDATSSERRGKDVIYAGRVSREAVRSASNQLRAFLAHKLQHYEQDIP